MAEEKIGSSTYFLFIDPLGGTAYSNVVCIENFDISGSVGTTDASTMCGPDSEPGDISASISLTAQTLLNPDTEEISAPDLFDLFNNKTTFSWKIGKAIPGATDFTKTGDGYFSAYGEQYSKDSKGKFTATITVAGSIVQTIGAGS